MKLRWILAAALAVALSPASAAELKVLDGDSFTFNGESIRIWGIDTPDANQDCKRAGKNWRPGPEAAAALREILARSQDMVCETREVDRFDRKVATCRAGGKDIGTQMVASGWAWDYFEYSRGFYIYAEAEARKAGIGVWSGDCQPPWRYRRAQTRPTPPQSMSPLPRTEQRRQPN